jgi:YfiH family protein
MGNSIPSNSDGHLLLYSDETVEFFISTRQNGFSKGPFGHNNLGLNTADNPTDVRKNRQMYFDRFNIEPGALVFSEQVHGSEIYDAGEGAQLMGYDGLVTTKPGLCLCVTVADCFPVLLQARKNRKIALLHMGWRGTAGGILAKAMTSHFAGIAGSELHLIIGPGIAPKHYEVGPEVKAYFSPEHWTNTADQKGLLDVGGAILTQFIENGGTRDNVIDQRLCTYDRNDLFYSYRRDGKKSGRMLAIARLKRKECHDSY